MKLYKHHILAVLLISLTSLAVAPGKQATQEQNSRRAAPGLSIHKYDPGTFSFLSNTGSGRGARANKRHGKSLVSEGIVADFAVPPAQFIYWNRKYSLFLPGGCARRAFSHSRLRGPPFCC